MSVANQLADASENDFLIIIAKTWLENWISVLGNDTDLSFKKNYQAHNAIGYTFQHNQVLPGFAIWEHLYKKKCGNIQR